MTSLKLFADQKYYIHTDIDLQFVNQRRNLDWIYSALINKDVINSWDRVFGHLHTRVNYVKKVNKNTEVILVDEQKSCLFKISCFSHHK